MNIIVFEYTALDWSSDSDVLGTPLFGPVSAKSLFFAETTSKETLPQPLRAESCRTIFDVWCGDLYSSLFPRSGAWSSVMSITHLPLHPPQLRRDRVLTWIFKNYPRVTISFICGGTRCRDIQRL